MGGCVGRLVDGWVGIGWLGCAIGCRTVGFAIPMFQHSLFYSTLATCRCIVASQQDTIIRHVGCRLVGLEDILLCMASSRTTTRHIGWLVGWLGWVSGWMCR